MVIKINGKEIDFHVAAKETEKVIKEANREVRRNKSFKLLSSSLAALSAIGILSLKIANGKNITEADAAEAFASFPFESKMYDKGNHFAWQMTEYMTNVLFQTKDFFGNPSILHMWQTMWYVVLSCTVFVVGKKGFDMIRARVLGSNSSQGASEFIVRLLASLLMTFMSLSVMRASIKFSNILAQTFVNNFAKGTMIFESVQNMSEAYIGSFFWLTGYIVMFIIIGVRYWIRQINIIFLGMMAPVASMSWVTDGGAMLNTLIKEFVTALTTPLAQAVTLSVGTTVLLEVASHTGEGFVSFLNSMLISVSTMVLMIISPDILRKFITNSANPFSNTVRLLGQLKGVPTRLSKMMR